jgi:hypothetical protein
MQQTPRPLVWILDSVAGALTCQTIGLILIRYFVSVFRIGIAVTAYNRDHELGAGTVEI